MNARIQLAAENSSSFVTDALVVTVQGEIEKSAVVSKLDKQLGGGLVDHLKKVDFVSEKGVVAEVPSLGRIPARRLIFVGVLNGDGGDGARFSAEARLAEAIAVGVRTALVSEPKTIVVVLGEEGMFQAAGLGAALGAYAFDKYLTEPPQRPGSIKVVASGGVTAAAKKSFQLGLRQADGVCLARDLINEPPNVLTPKEFSLRAREVAKKNKLTCKILDHAGIKKAGMHLHDAVGKGSENSPYFIHLCYKPAARSQGKLCFVGKGLTFDSGGLCIKPGPSMPEMKTDMSGGAAVLGLMEAVAAFAPNVEVHGIIGAAENMPDAAAYRPSDVLPSLSGKGVEIINTDAEGRLVLADALTYATRLKPDLIVDAATLTGATLVSLGAPCSAYFTNNEGIAAAMGECSAAAGESFWRMPLLEELRLQLKSTVTDLKHTGDRWGGAITAALFLREFTEGLPWMHCDIPGAVFRDRPSGMHPLGGTGHAVLTFLQLVLRHEKEPMVKKASSSSSRKAVRKTRASKK